MTASDHGDREDNEDGGLLGRRVSFLRLIGAAEDDDDLPELTEPASNAVIAVDAMGGDQGPAAVVAGLAKCAKSDPDLKFLLFGDAAELEPLLQRRPTLSDRVEIRHAKGVVAMDAKPSRAVRSGRDTSMRAAIMAVNAGEAGAAVSCGNTGALMALSMMVLRRAPGVSRPAIAVLWPSRNPTEHNIVLDVGADIRADPESLAQFAVMGAEYAKVGLGLDRPRVGLLNVGAEAHKGGAELHEAARQIANAALAPETEFSYIGFVEADAIPGDRVDVVVTDGFTGNVALKSAEGTARLVSDFLSEALRKSLFSKIGALFSMTSFMRLRKRIDPRRVNGGVFLGLNGTVVKSHGAADATGVAAALALAARMARSHFADRVTANISAQSGGSAPIGKADPRQG